ncbi:MAG: EAL domain-containing protein [Bacillota bacterium]|nr:EAL domain-containing protein [Bacillota bacterium]
MKILYFDIAAIIIVSILLTSLIIRKMVSGRSNKLFLLLVILILIPTVLDLWAEAFGIWIPAKESNTLLRQILCYSYFFLRNLTPLVYQLFICAVTDTWHIQMKNKWMNGILFTPYVVVCGMLLTNPIHHLVFYIDDALVYSRGALMYVLYGVSFFYLFYGIIYLFTYKKMLAADKFIALMLMYPLNALAILIQMFFPTCLVEMFMTSLMTLLIALVIQRPEEIINPILGIRNYVSFTSDMKKAYSIDKPVWIIFAKLVNYPSVVSLLDSNTANLLLKKVAADLSLVSREEHLSMDLYYLENGLFAFVSEKNLPEKLRVTAQQVSETLTEPKQLGQFELDLEPCICVLRCPEDINAYERLLPFGNSLHTYFPSDGTVHVLSEEKEQRMFRLRNEIDGIIRHALAEKRFQMYYQPIYSAAEKRFLSAEALIRLYDETYGYISPELLISAAEKNGMILQIGEFVLEDVCRLLAKCKQGGVAIDYIEINLSMAQCIQKDLKDTVMDHIQKHHLKPEQINLEITETIANTAQDIVEENIQNLSKEGISFSLDDYGTGYSNISRILSLPFRIVKLDKSFVEKRNDGKMRIVLKNTIRMLKAIGAEIVVEGVETKEDLQHFLALGCDYIQGYYFSKPLSEQEFVAFMQSPPPVEE